MAEDVAGAINLVTDWANSAIENVTSYANKFNELAQFVVSPEPIKELDLDSSTKGIEDKLESAINKLSDISGPYTGFGHQLLDYPTESLVVPTLTIDTTLDNVVQPIKDFVRPDYEPSALKDVSVQSPSVTIPTITADIVERPSITYPSDLADSDFTIDSTPDAPTVSLPTNNLGWGPTFSAQMGDITRTNSIPEIDLDGLFSGIQMPNSSLLQPLSYTEPTYHQQIDDLTIAKLCDYLENGGYGIDITDETQLINRAKDAVAKLAASAMQNVEMSFTQSGFALPNGILLAARLQAAQDYRDKVADSMANIYNDRAKRYVDAEQQTIQNSIGVMQLLRNYFNAVQDRALRAAEAVSSASVTMYNAMLEKTKMEIAMVEAKATEYKIILEAYNAETENIRSVISIYTAEAQIYETRMRGYQTQAQVLGIMADIEKTKVQIYATEIEAWAKKLEAKKLFIDIYTARLEAVKVKMQIYSTDLGASKIKVETQVASLDAVKILIAKYQADLEGEKLKIANYQAQLGFTELQTKIYSIDASVYQSDVSAALETAKIGLAKIEGEKQKAELQIELFDRQLKEYLAQMEYTSKQNEAISESFKMEMDKYKTLGILGNSLAQIGLDKIKTSASIKSTQWEALVKKAQIEMSNLEAEVSLKTELAKGLSGVMATLASGAASGVSTVAAQIANS